MENHNLKVGDRMRAKVKTVISSGVFLNIAKNKDGYLHISELSSNRVENINDHVKVGDEFDVDIIKIDPETGKIKLRNLNKNNS